MINKSKIIIGLTSFFAVGAVVGVSVGVPLFLLNKAKKHNVPTSNYAINFKDEFPLNAGDGSKLASDSSINEEWIKNKVIENWTYYFIVQSSTSNEINEFFFKENISISNFIPDDSEGSISFDLKLTNNLSSVSPSFIEKRTVITGFLKLNDIESGMNDFINYFSNINISLYGQELESLNTNLLTTKIKEKINNNDFDFVVKSFISNETNHKIVIEVEVISKKYTSITKIFKNVSISYLNLTDVSFLETVAESVRLVPSTSSGYNYQDITAKNYYKMKNNSLQWRDYFEINITELEEKFDPQEFSKVEILWLINGDFNFLEPTTVNFQIEIKYKNNGEIEKKTLTTKFTDFKEDDSVLGELDKMPIENLVTPNGSISYKGRLEKYTFDDIKITSNNNYKSLNDKMTWDMLKEEVMYQVRFALYQMFSDNFSEINYYISSENQYKQIVAVGEGIIKEDKENVRYYFQFLGGQNAGSNNYINLKKGNKIKIKITLEGFENRWQPVAFDYSQYDDYSWNFKNNCENLDNDVNNPLFLKGVHRSNLGLSYFEISVDDNIKYVSGKVNTWSTYVFVLRRKYK